jgi:iron complex transport system ATP-binding protein
MTGLRAAGVGVRIGDREVVREASFEVASGEFLAIVGPNGAGKTTLLRALAGLLRLDRGNIHVGSLVIAGMSARERARDLAFLAPARIALPVGFTVEEVVALGCFARDDARAAGRTRIRAAIDRFRLGALCNRGVETLSDGERQRVWLAAIEAQDAGVILLDEPTAHLDVARVAETLAVLRSWCRQGRAVIAVIHDLDAAIAAADRVAVMVDGALRDPVAVASLTAAALGASFEVTLASVQVAHRQRVIVMDYEVSP